MEYEDNEWQEVYSFDYSGGPPDPPKGHPVLDMILAGVLLVMCIYGVVFLFLSARP